MNFLRTLFSRAFQASGQHPEDGISEPATTSNSVGAPVCLTEEEDVDDNPRTMHSSSLLTGDSFREESIPWQLC